MDIFLDILLKPPQPLMGLFLLAATKLGQGNIFTSVCLSTGGRGVCLSACWDTHPPPEQTHTPEQTPPPGSRPPGSRHTLPPGADTPPEQTPPDQAHTPQTAAYG